MYRALLQTAKEAILMPLVRLIRASLMFSYVPEAWRKTRVVFIVKTGRRIYDSSKDFRQISLTPSF